MVKLFSDISRDWSLRSLAQIILIRFLIQNCCFKKLTGSLKKSGFILSTLYCPLGDQKPLEKQAFGLKSIKNAYYFKSRKSYHKLRLALL